MSSETSIQIHENTGLQCINGRHQIQSLARRFAGALCQLGVHSIAVVAAKLS